MSAIARLLSRRMAGVSLLNNRAGESPPTAQALFFFLGIRLVVVILIGGFAAAAHRH